MFDQSLDALINTAVTFGQNIIPAIKGALSGVGYLIEGLAPVIGETIPPLINDLAPTLANSAVSLISSLVNGPDTERNAIFRVLEQYDYCSGRRYFNRSATVNRCGVKNSQQFNARD